jgi:hypothetical protein
MIKSMRMRWAGRIARMEKRNGYMILVKTPERKLPLVKSGCRWEDNTKMDIREIEWGGMVWIHLPQDKNQRRALVNMAMDLQVP